ncbi:MAG: ankyrin repeat domain-containing protein [Planctomycetota bacterium]
MTRRALALLDDGEWVLAPDSEDRGIRLLHATSGTKHTVLRDEVPCYKAAAISVPAKAIALLRPSDREGRGPYGLQVWRLRFRGDPEAPPPPVGGPGQSPTEARARLEALGIPVGEDSLFAQVRAKNEIAVRLLLKVEVPPNAAESSGDTALTLAVENGSLPIVKALIEGGADLNRTGPEGSPPIHLAAEHGKVECARLLLEARTKIGEEIDRGFPVNVVTPTIDRDARDALGRTALIAAIVSRQPLEVIRLFLDQGFDPSAAGTDRESPLLAAIEHDDLALLRLLLSHRVHEDAPDASGRTPLARACMAGRLEMVKALANAGADVSIPDHDGKLPLAHAIEHEWQASSPGWRPEEPTRRLRRFPRTPRTAGAPVPERPLLTSRAMRTAPGTVRFMQDCPGAVPMKGNRLEALPLERRCRRSHYSSSETDPGSVFLERFPHGDEEVVKRADQTRASDPLRPEERRDCKSPCTKIL